MRTTLNLDPELLQEAIKVTGVAEKTRVIHLGLRALLQEAARQRLARLRGTVRKASGPKRRKMT